MRGKLLGSAKGWGRAAEERPAKRRRRRVASTMSRGRVAICALIAMFIFGALAGPAMAKKEYKKEFEASGPEVKLETQAVGSGAYEIILPFEEKGHLAKPYKFKCTELDQSQR